MESKNTPYSFDINTFNIKLETEWLGREFLFIDEIDSTNTLLMGKNSEFKANGSVLLAEKQLAGKGRMDRTWYSSKFENLTFSILISGERYLKANPLVYNFGAVVAAAKTIESLFQLYTKVKWPNDLLISEKKICGILCESIISGERLSRLVIGVGLNVNQTNFQGEYNIIPTSLMKELGEPAQRERVLAEFLNEFEEIIEKGIIAPAKILKEWKDRCPHFGDRIGIKQGEKIYNGVFDDLDENGALILRVDGEYMKFHYGEVSLIR